MTNRYLSALQVDTKDHPFGLSLFQCNQVLYRARHVDLNDVYHLPNRNISAILGPIEQDLNPSPHLSETRSLGNRIEDNEHGMSYKSKWVTNTWNRQRARKERSSDAQTNAGKPRTENLEAHTNRPRTRGA
jgi:hypothetical protein